MKKNIIFICAFVSAMPIHSMQRMAISAIIHKEDKAPDMEEVQKYVLDWQHEESPLFAPAVMHTSKQETKANTVLDFMKELAKSVEADQKSQNQNQIYFEFHGPKKTSHIAPGGAVFAVKSKSDDTTDAS